MTEPREPTDQLGIGATDMTDRTHPDSGSTHIIRYALEMGSLWIDGDGRDKVREAIDALDILEAQLSSSGFTAADMASAPAQGFRDGVASLAASAGSEPVAYAMFADNGNIRLWSKARIPHPDAKPLYLHPSPPEGMVAEQALRKVLSVVQRYLPPDGPTAHDAMTEITEIVDPWPLGPLEKP